MEDVNAKLGARNLEVEAELTCKMSEQDLTSKGVQCDTMDLSSVEAEIADRSSRGYSQRCSFDGVLEAVQRCDLAHLRVILHTCAPEEVNVTTEGEGMSALHLAASAGQTEAVRLLLGNKKFEAVNSHASMQGNLYTALHSASFAGHEGGCRTVVGQHSFFSDISQGSAGQNSTWPCSLARTCRSGRPLTEIRSP